MRKKSKKDIDEELKARLLELRSVVLGKEEEKLKNDVISELKAYNNRQIDAGKMYYSIAAEIVAIEAVLVKRKMDAFGVPVGVKIIRR